MLRFAIYLKSEEDGRVWTNFKTYEQAVQFMEVCDLSTKKYVIKPYRKEYNNNKKNI